MKKYKKEVIISLIQLIVFYIEPFFRLTDNPIGMIEVILLITFTLSIILGIISNKKIKFLYPIIISILFIPSVFIYYNDSALIHSLWYLIISFIGICTGTIIKKILK